jgi:hypothetical protein
LPEHNGYPKSGTAESDSPLDDDLDADFPTTSAADVESAGRSCLVILVMGVIILILLLLWVAFGLSGGAGR